MIEELAEYLTRNGWSEDIADDIHSAYLDYDMDGVRKIAATFNDEEHDYTDEIVKAVMQWQIECGENPVG